MKIENSVALVTGANRGLGLAFARALQARGARKIYAAARDPATVTLPGVVPLRLDVTRPDQIAAAAREAPDLTLLVNNAAIARGQGLLGDATLDNLRAELDTNVFGPLLATRAFAPVLAHNGGGAIVNMLSVLSWLPSAVLPTYAATKAAAWSITNGLREALRGQGTQVVGVHAGYVDTDLARLATGPKARPEDVAARVLDAVEAGAEEVLADDISRAVKLGLALDPAIYLQPRG